MGLQRIRHDRSDLHIHRKPYPRPSFSPAMVRAVEMFQKKKRKKKRKDLACMAHGEEINSFQVKTFYMVNLLQIIIKVFFNVFKPQGQRINGD